METDAIVGCLIIAAAVGLLTFLVLASRRRIDRIGRRGYRSARDILKDLDREG